MIKKIVPIIPNFRATSLSKAFILNALATAFIAGLAIEMRIQLINNKSNVYGYFNKLLLGEKLSEIQIVSIVITTTFVVALIVYQLMYIFFQFGGGMLST
jgi:hypothetical protein